MPKYIKELYYITHINNLPSILRDGIFSHRLIEQKGISYTPIYDKQIVERRSGKSVTSNKTLWDYANLYYQARNPMLYRVVHEKPLSEVAVIGIRRDVMNQTGVYLTDGNAASSTTSFVLKEKGQSLFKGIAENTQGIEWWSEADGSKRRIMAECLVPDTIQPEYIQTIYVANLDVQRQVKQLVGGCSVDIVPQGDMFFEPTRVIQLTQNLKLVEGDLFFSKMQTLTISVNCMGVMGKGLASRAKYQFPRVYVYYEDLCKQKKLHLGKPVLYKQEQSRDFELADEPATMANGLTETWFLLFPTKDNWRNRADMEGIRKGLQWLVDNYKAEGVKSLAMPALGCGLGWLDWSSVGPVLCTLLSKLDIEVWIYLPAERKLPDDQLSGKFLLRNE
jgi:O-acetyl-ADP-ribose deacetylase (regulator of RNase III)